MNIRAIQAVNDYSQHPYLLVGEMSFPVRTMDLPFCLTSFLESLATLWKHSFQQALNSL